MYRNSSSRLNEFKLWETRAVDAGKNLGCPAFLKKKEKNIQVHILSYSHEIYGNVSTVFFVIANNTVYQGRRNKDFDFYRSSQLRRFERKIFLRRASQLPRSSRLVVLRKKKWHRYSRSTPPAWRIALLLLFFLPAQVDNVHVQTGMAFADMSASVWAVPSTVLAVRTLESRLLVALVFQMVGQTALAAEGTTAIRAGKLLRARGRPHHRRRHRRQIRRRTWRMVGRLEDVAWRDVCGYMVIPPNSAWNTKKTHRSRQIRDTICPIRDSEDRRREWINDYNLYVSNLLAVSYNNDKRERDFREIEVLSMIKCRPMLDKK